MIYRRRERHGASTGSELQS